MDLVLRVPLTDIWLDLVLGEVSNRGLDELVLVGERKVDPHRGALSPPPRSTVGRMGFRARSIRQTHVASAGAASRSPGDPSTHGWAHFRGIRPSKRPMNARNTDIERSGEDFTGRDMHPATSGRLPAPPAPCCCRCPGSSTAASVGCTSPGASVARQDSTCSPGWASHSNVHDRHANVTDRLAERRLRPCAVDADLDPGRSAPEPDHARPQSSAGPASTSRWRLKKSGMPGGTISARGRMRVTGSPGSSSALSVKWYARRLLVAGERLRRRPRSSVSHLTLRHAVPAGHDQPQREPVLRLERPRRSSAYDQHDLRAAAPRRASGCAGSPARRSPWMPWSAPVNTISTASSGQAGLVEQRRTAACRSTPRSRSPRSATAG